MSLDAAGGTRLRRSATALSERFDDIEVVFDLRTGLVRRLNASATTIWRLLTTAYSRDEIVEQLMANDVVNAGLTAASVLRFVDELEMWDLVERVGE